MGDSFLLMVPRWVRCSWRIELLLQMALLGRGRQRFVCFKLAGTE